MHRPHLVFKIDFNGIARELRSEATVIDPISKNVVQVTKAVWDTGATGTSIKKELAVFLGLPSVGVTNVHTANGIVQQFKYLIQVKLPNGLVVNNITATGGDFGPETDLLIGMDVIGIGDFILQNDNGKTQFCFCWPPMKRKYNIWNLANSENAIQAKKNKGKK